MGRNHDIDIVAILENIEPTHALVDVRDYLQAWDEAAMNRDRPKMIALLLQTAIERDQAERTTDAVLENPKMYGF